MRLLLSGLRLTGAERRFAAGAWLLAPVVTVVLRRLGLRKTLELVRERISFGAAHRGLTLPVARAEAIVARVFRMTLAHDSCLPRAIVQLSLHRWSGDDVKLVIGVRRGGRFGDREVDFEGHAWIEEAGGPRRDTGHDVIFESPSA